MAEDAHFSGPRDRQQRNCVPNVCLAAAALATILAVVGPESPQPACAQTFQEASFRALEEIIRTNAARGPLLDVIGQNSPAGVISAPPATTTQAAAGPVIERRLQTVRESEERRRSSEASPLLYASRLADASQPDERLRLPRPGGAGAEIAVGPARGLSLFLSGGASVLEHHKNRFEDGYTAKQPTVTIGADYLLTPRLLVGAAFSYTDVEGSFHSGGTFEKDIVSPSLYGLVLPFDGVFISAIVSYARSDNSHDRPVIFPPAQGVLVIGETSGDYVERRYAAEFMSGYDHPLGRFTVGPRLGVAIAHSRVEAFTEEGRSGGELHYAGFNQTSVQSSLGVAASVAIAMPSGVLVPQLNVAWVHEYAHDEREVRARFVHASLSPDFTFKRERPARDWANIVLGVSALFANGGQFFAQFVTVQGNKNYVSYGGVAGLRFSF